MPTPAKPAIPDNPGPQSPASPSGPTQPPSSPVVPSAPPAAPAGKISTDLQNIIAATPPWPTTPQPSVPTVPVIVQFSNPATSSDQQSIQNLGGVNTGDFPLIQASAITVLPDRVADLANLPNVAFVTLDRPVAAILDFVAATTSAM